MKSDRNDEVLSEQLLFFLKKIDNDFYPSLSSKVNLHDYVEKIIDKAELILDFDDDKIKGMVVLYCNDYVNRKAYIPLVGVCPEYRNRGVAKKLMSDAIQIVKDRDFILIGIHSNNPVAILLYESLGFVVVRQGKRSYMEMSINKMKK